MGQNCRSGKGQTHKKHRQQIGEYKEECGGNGGQQKGKIDFFPAVAHDLFIANGTVRIIGPNEEAGKECDDHRNVQYPEIKITVGFIF